MARLVLVCDNDNSHEFQRRQVPIEVDSMKMVVQFSDKCVDCENMCGVKQKDVELFRNKFATLTNNEIAVALLVSGKEVLKLLSHSVPCVGCRKSVERLFRQLQKSQHPALEPLVITQRGELSLRPEYVEPKSLFSLFHVHGSKLHSVVESIPKSKKNKRCNLHSLETHKSRTLGCWLEAWEALSNSCREKVLIVDMNHLLSTIDSYLEKHKFCGECKSKVLLAYNILIGEQDSTQEKGYCAALYENLRCCAKVRHIHVYNDTDFIAHLLEKAEPEFLGGKRDRHAKTLDIAQEEVLTCLGIHIFERLHRIWQKLRSEEQTWLILFYVGVDALRKSYQSALEEKQGASNLELLCEELEEKEKRQVEKKELKRQKKKQRKAKAQETVSKSNTSNVHKSCVDDLVIEDVCSCASVKTSDATGHSKNRHHRNAEGSCRDANFNSLTLSLQDCNMDNHQSSCLSRSLKPTTHDRWHYMLDSDSCESCSLQGSNEGSEEGECSSSFTDSVDSCECDVLRGSPKKAKCPQSSGGPLYVHERNAFQTGDQPMLQDLLESHFSDEEEGGGISEEEILAFKARQGEVDSKRQKLRQHLRQRFQELHLSSHFNTM